MFLDELPRLTLARLPTPVDHIEELSRQWGVQLFIKRDDLTGSLTGGNKVRKLEYTLAAAQRAGADTIISCGATQTNHGRTLAALCARLGLRCHLLLLGDQSDENLGNHFLIRLLGSRVTCITLSQYLDRDRLLHDAAEDERRLGYHPFLVPTGASDALGSLGYIRAAREIAADEAALSVSFDHIVVACGSGGTAAGLAAGASLLDRNWNIHGVMVCDDAAWFRHVTTEILNDLRRLYVPDLRDEFPALHFVAGFKGRGYGRSDPGLRQDLVALARRTGLVLDPVYTMKAWRGMKGLIQSGVIATRENILFLHTGGTHGLLGKAGQFTTADFKP